MFLKYPTTRNWHILVEDLKLCWWTKHGVTRVFYWAVTSLPVLCDWPETTWPLPLCVCLIGWNVSGCIWLVVFYILKRCFCSRPSLLTCSLWCVMWPRWAETFQSEVVLHRTSCLEEFNFVCVKTWLKDKWSNTLYWLHKTYTTTHRWDLCFTGSLFQQ